MEEDDVTIREQNFHSQVREYIVCFLLFAVLYIVSYCIISRYKRKSDEQEDEDAIVNRISMYLCTFTLAVSGGAVLLLPFSIISYEILLSLPKNYYIQWLNGSLIHGLWNLVSLFSNLCLFVLMPFAYFFLESEGFAGSKKILEDLDEQIYCIQLQEEALERRLNGMMSNSYFHANSQNHLYKELDNIRNQRNKLASTPHNIVELQNVCRFECEQSFGVKPNRAISVLLVALNIVYLLVDETALPKGSTIIGCCVSILVLSSALPVMSRTLGITRFDLLGDFGRFNWLGNFYIVLSYNLLFAVVTTLCLVRKFTSAVREELLKALGLDKLNLSNSTTDAESGKHAVNGHQKTL
ncbi:hypothetical protein cypCar_00028216 [Cyprinus carpio]|nr:hypothetical protein cypCar_00028216 [Cyprinus carpio]